MIASTRGWEIRAAGFGGVLAEIDRAHLGELGDAEALGEIEAGVFAGGGVGPGFQRRGGGGEDDGGALDRGAQHRHVAGVVERAVLLLVGAVVLLVDDDQAEVGEGQEERGAGADDEAGVAGGDRGPGPAAGGLRHAGVPLGGAGAEAGLDPVEELGGEGYLGEKDQGLAAAGQRLGDGFEIDLGLAGAGDALEERGGVGAGADRGAQRRRGFGLGGGERARLGGGVEVGVGGVAGRGLAQEHALGFEAGDDRGRDAGEAGELERREAGVAELVEGGEDARARRGAAGGLGAGAAEQRPRGGRLAEAGRSRGEPQHDGERGQGVVGGAGEERAHRRRQRGRVEHAGDVAELLRCDVARAGAPDQPEHPARTERHLDEVARPGACGGRAVVEQPVEAVGGQHRDRLARSEEVRGIRAD